MFIKILHTDGPRYSKRQNVLSHAGIFTIFIFLMADVL